MISDFLQSLQVWACVLSGGKKKREKLERSGAGCLDPWGGGVCEEAPNAALLKLPPDFPLSLTVEASCLPLPSHLLPHHSSALGYFGFSSQSTLSCGGAALWGSAGEEQALDVPTPLPLFFFFPLFLLLLLPPWSPSLTLTLTLLLVPADARGEEDGGHPSGLCADGEAREAAGAGPGEDRQRQVGGGRPQRHQGGAARHARDGRLSGCDAGRRSLVYALKKKQTVQPL